MKKANNFYYFFYRPNILKYLTKFSPLTFYSTVCVVNYFFSVKECTTMEVFNEADKMSLSCIKSNIFSPLADSLHLIVGHT